MSPVVSDAFGIDVSLAHQRDVIGRRRLGAEPGDAGGRSNLREQEPLVVEIEIESDDVGQVGDGGEGRTQRLGIERHAADLRPGGEDQILLGRPTSASVLLQGPGRAAAHKLLGRRLREGETELLALGARCRAGRIGRRLVGRVEDGHVAQAAQSALDLISRRRAVGRLGSAEERVEVAVDPVDRVPEQGQAHGIGQVAPNQLPVPAHERYLLDGVLARVDPVDVVRGHVDGEVARTADARRDQRSPLRSVQQGFADDRELAVVDPVEQPFDGVDGQLARRFLVGADQFHAVGTV